MLTDSIIYRPDKEDYIKFKNLLKRMFKDPVSQARFLLTEGAELYDKAHFSEGFVLESIMISCTDADEIGYLIDTITADELADDFGVGA